MESTITSLPEQEVQNVLKAVLDPEIGLNIVDLGLVYSINIEDTRIVVNMTLTTSGCPMGDIILNDVYELLRDSYQKHEIQINLVWEPAWDSKMISPEGKAFLGY